MRTSMKIAALLAATVASPLLAQDAGHEWRQHRQPPAQAPARMAQAPQHQEGGYRSPWVQNRTDPARPQPQAQSYQPRPGQQSNRTPSPAASGYRSPWIPNAEWQARQGRGPDRSAVVAGQSGQGANDWRGHDHQGNNGSRPAWNGNSNGAGHDWNRDHNDGRDDRREQHGYVQNWQGRDRDSDHRDWNRQNWDQGHRWDNNRSWDRGHDWNRDWRRDQRFDWQRYRYSNRSLFSQPYYAPYGWGRGYQRFSIGVSLGNLFYDQQYWIDDPYAYRLPPAYGSYRWVRYYDDVLLVDLNSGQVVDAIYDFFW